MWTHVYFFYFLLFFSRRSWFTFLIPWYRGHSTNKSTQPSFSFSASSASVSLLPFLVFAYLSSFYKNITFSFSPSLPLSLSFSFSLSFFFYLSFCLSLSFSFSFSFSFFFLFFFFQKSSSMMFYLFIISFNSVSSSSLLDQLHNNHTLMWRKIFWVSGKRMYLCHRPNIHRYTPPESPCRIPRAFSGALFLHFF